MRVISRSYLHFGRFARVSKTLFPIFMSQSLFSSEHKYSKKTTKEIENQISLQKWKEMQNTFKSLNSKFGLKKPTLKDLESKNYAKPTKVEYSLETLRQCSQSYPIYLHWELEQEGSSFNQVVGKVVENLWKAEEKEALEFLEFLYAWDYKKADILGLHEMIINKFDLTMSQLFSLLKRFEGKLSPCIQIKVIERLQLDNLSSAQYGDLLKIVNFFTIKGLLSDQFYLAVTQVMSSKINKIPPAEALEAYVYFTYNMGEHTTMAEKQKESQKEKEDLGVSIIKVIEKRILSPECLNFYNGDQLVALLHTFLKNNLVLSDESKSEEYQRKLNKIVGRVELGYYAKDFSSKNKQSLLEICSLLPQLKKQTVIALVQSELLKKNEKFDFHVLPELYLASYENGMLTEEIEGKIHSGITENLFLLDKKAIPRVLWLMTLNGAKNMGSIHSKAQAIVEGGLKEFSIQDVCIMVWSMCASNYNQQAPFWDSIESYLLEQLQREAKDAASTSRLLNSCSWILWSYHNNRELGIQLIDLISQIIIQEFPVQSASQVSPESPLGIERTLSTFQLVNITSFFYSLDFPAQTVIDRIKTICVQQFFQVYPTMAPIQLCKCLKYLGPQAWKDKNVANGVLQIFESQFEKIAYRDIMTVVAILISSPIKTRRVSTLIGRLMERKKQLESLQGVGGAAAEESPKQKMGKWKFPI